MNCEFDITYFYIDVCGAKFSPRNAEEELGLSLYEKLEVGTPMTNRARSNPRYGQRSTLGWGVLQAPPRVAYRNQTRWLMQTLLKHNKALRRLGATDIVYWEVRYILRDQQENFELSSAEISALHKAKAHYCLSIYHQTKKDFKKMGSRLYSKRWEIDPQ